MFFQTTFQLIGWSVLLALTLNGPFVEGSQPFNETRIVAIGDIHGDYSQAVKVLKMAGIIDDKARWAAPEGTVFVQTGDVVDRGPDTIKLYKLLSRLRDEAPNSNGQVVSLLGNHEVMNMMEDYRYVTEEDLETFGGEEKRKEAFSKKGWIGQYLRGLNITANVDGNIFCHGGVTPKYANQGIDSMNTAATAYLNKLSIDQLYQTELLGGDGPLWYRGYALNDEGAACSTLSKALKALKAKRMVMGHTVQEDGRITARCGGKIVLIDVGISKAYHNALAALEIDGDILRVIYPEGIEKLVDHDYHDEL